MLAAIMVLPYAVWKDTVCQVYVPAWLDGRQDTITASWRDIDRQLLAASRNGNVAVCFHNFSSSAPDQQLFAEAVVYRGTYTLYPRRVLASDRRTIVRRASQVLDQSFEPTLDWLRGNDVRSVITCTALPGGKLSVRVDPVPREIPSPGPEQRP